MIILDCEQLSPEWVQARCGIPTSSNFDKIIKVDGKPSKQAMEYMRKLAWERIKGSKSQTYQSPDMKRGIENEPQARNLYAFVNDVEVVQIGLCFRDEQRKFAHSPDGFVGDDGEIEIKDAKESVHLKRLFDGWSKAEHFQQIQGGLFITGRKWCDRISNHHDEGSDRDLPQIIHRYERDQEFHIKLKCALVTFCEELDRVTGQLRGMV